MTNLHQNENRGREAIGRDSTGRPLSTADLAAAAQRPSDPAKPGTVGGAANASSSAASSVDEQRRESQRQARRDAEPDEIKEAARTGQRDLRDDEETGTFEALDPHRRGASGSAGSAPKTDSAGGGRTTPAMASMGNTQQAIPAEAASRTESQDSDQSDTLEPLFTADRAETYRTRWLSIQSSFVDDPRQAVRSGDELVAQVMANLASTFAEERHRMESQLDETGEGATENLRVALRRYRSFFDRLLSL